MPYRRSSRMRRRRAGSYSPRNRQKRRNRKMNSYRQARGGIRL